jgi:S-DNA-T family DNA segregation ATPase FtsK/SpoIIIE
LPGPFRRAVRALHPRPPRRPGRGHAPGDRAGWPAGPRHPADTADLALCEALARRLGPLRLDGRAASSTATGPVRLLDLLNHLDHFGRPRLWADVRGFLQIPIGATPEGNPLILDLKEAAEAGIGPHGLVIGATGSGKSELLRTIVAGLAATHPPDQLAFVLVDFKGGAAFADLALLPQVAGLITNLQADLSMVDRAMAALQGELDQAPAAAP